MLNSQRKLEDKEKRISQKLQKAESQRLKHVKELQSALSSNGLRTAEDDRRRETIH